jgi:hypothetical protein
MIVDLPSSAARLIKGQLASGKLATAEQVVVAALHVLEQKPIGDFAAGELDKQLADGEASIIRHGTLNGANALTARRKRRQRTRRDVA